MKYYITIIRNNKKNREILGEYDDLNTALNHGEEFSKSAERGDIISCYYGNINENNEFVGKYLYYNSWL